MKHIICCCFLIGSSLAAFAQQLYTPSSAVIAGLPTWAQEMYSSNPNVLRVDSLYQDYFTNHAFVSDYNTQYYRIWRKKNAHQIGADGFIQQPSETQMRAAFQTNNTQTNSRTGWTLVGAEKVFDENGDRVGEQTNTYCIDQSETQDSVLFCGTEPGEIYKSIDAGTNWFLVSSAMPNVGGITAIEIDPTTSQIVYAGANSMILQSLDGGANWNPALVVTNLGVNEILVNPIDPQVVLAACSKGLYRSTDGGLNWSPVFTQACYDVKFNAANADIVYLLKNNPSQDRCEFFSSTDRGATFTQQTNGWYASNDPNRSDMGARLAVSVANPNRIYAYLIGDAKVNDYGFIGVYRSDDGGASWSLPNGPDGGPYTASHPNLAYGVPSWTYHQGFYNCAIMASPTNADMILIGGLNLWRSDDGGATFSSVAGYVGGPLNIHVDMQDFRPTPTGVWITNDGGIYHSTDFFQANNEVRMDGVHGSEFWGFGTGWNEDVMVGGLYHNGTIAYHENYPSKTFLQLGGAEPASGYVNPGVNTRVYSSDIGGAILPSQIGQPIQRFSVGLWPNESYYSAESSEMEFDPRCWNHVFIGNQNKLFKSEDGGGAYNLVYTFGASTNNKIIQIEIAWTNPDVMYVCQYGGTGKLWKTTDGGTTWTQLTIPAGNSSRLIITLSPTNADSLWLAYPSGANGNKMFVTTNGGTSWTNISDPDLDNEEIRWIHCIGNADGGVYAITNETVHYRNNTTNAWATDNLGLPLSLAGLSIKPFYRDGKIRASSYGRGIWENPLNDMPASPVAQPQVDKLNYVINCVADTFYFEDHSIVKQVNATWQWAFPGGTPASSNLRNPKVVYNTPGTYTVTLIVTDAGNQSDTGSLVITVSAYQQNTSLVEGFQTNFPPTGWWSDNTGNGGQWALSTACGGYGNSTQATIFDNFSYDAQGGTADLRIRADMTQQNTSWLFFDRAYAEYGFPYSDTLEVLVSTDCGATFTSVFRLGGSQLATAPSNQSSAFVPTASQWVTDSINLATWANQTDLMIVFRNIGRWGQAQYLDNINIGNSVSVNELNSSSGYVMLNPNPVRAGENLMLISNRDEQFEVEIFAPNGQLILKSVYGNKASIALPNLAAGTYSYRITGETMIRTAVFVVH